MTALLRAALAATAILLSAGLAAAQQQGIWLQIEAQPGRDRAQEAASRYAQRLERVAGFRLGSSGWYAIVVGPFESEAEAAAARRALRQQRAIPGDSFTTDGGSFRARFWPIGADDGTDSAAAAPGITESTLEDGNQAEPQGEDLGEAIAEVQQDDTPAPAETATDTAAETAVQAEATPPGPAEPRETVAEARRSERDLSAEERRELQIALQWAGFYDAGIDGAFGRGTRGAMADWQQARGYEATGVLTTRQRAALLGEYNAVFTEVGMARVEDDRAGIAIDMPTELVELAGYNPPFARYENPEGGPHMVLLISQEGDTDTLFGLFEILQTLEIVPPEGERIKRERNFTLVGRNDRIVSHTEARVRDGQIKGFTLVWPAGDEDRRARILSRMVDSFAPLPGVLPDRLDGAAQQQSVDLVSGLKIRTPIRSRSGFFVSDDGAVLTTAEAVAQCGRVTLDTDLDAEVAAMDEGAGLALLRPARPLAPRATAQFLTAPPRLGTELMASGFSFGGQLGAPSLTYGSLADLKGLNGDAALNRLELAARDGDAGGPVMDRSGAVLGMLVPESVAAEGGRDLPQGVSFAIDAEPITGFLGAQGVTPEAATAAGELSRGRMTRLAGDMTVLVSCWE